MSIILKMIFNNKTRSFRPEAIDRSAASDEESNETPTWCNTVQVLFL